ncbi:MAG: GNAT family N-acetyltransferase [Gammaproteobacteria bacterium]|nr:MAG: GNAT family N-acetyltransferase [Gammaproteobacteria bacterium]
MTTGQNSSSYLYSGDSLFEAPWWLDAVAPGSWHDLVVGQPGAAEARLVYQRVQRLGVNLVRNPPLTQTVGPRVRLVAEKHERRIAQIRDLVSDLIRQLPQATALRLVLAKDFEDFLPFRWAGIRVGLACTYRIREVNDTERVWHGFSESSRRAIRKAQRILTVRDDLSLETVIETARLSFQRQSMAHPYDTETVRRAVDAAKRNAGAWLLAAEDAQGRVHASMLIVYDATCAYYLLGGADPGMRDSGAQSLLIWEALRRCAGATSEFDFEGSSNPTIERFFRGFGPQRCPLLLISRASPWLRQAAAWGLTPRGLLPDP